MTELVVATRNPGKLREIASALQDLPIKILSLADFPGAPEMEEDGRTFWENALKKARAISSYTGRHSLADDSGIMVDALQGAPGVYSARYAGQPADDEKNNRKLLAALAGLPPEKRGARFIAVMVVAAPDGRTLVAEGSCEGWILEAPRGNLGFGYDPLFFYPPLQKTFSELPVEEKLKVSHRGQALRRLRETLGPFLTAGSNR